MTRMNSHLLLSAAGLLFIAGCTTTTTGPGGELERTRQGAITGAVIGGVIGGISDNDDRLENAAIGAAIGAAGGAIVGNILDKQAEELRRDLDGDIGVIRTGDALIVRMPQDILFDFDSAVVQPGLRSDLLTLAESLRRYPETTVEVTGHTDEVGSVSYNRDLSLRRANAVASVLIQAGVPQARIRTFGAGEDQPIATNATAEGRAANRRVDITIREN